ncbi:hypothetical protein OG204_30305 [Streptomyces sp. NBC_01387]|uniref:hypothetical protein n=1 Tax=Streptomyces sp. NBC_01387 TaxID=2903849 RepID=UPI0032447943
MSGERILPTAQPASGAAQLAALVAAGGFWHLAPDRVPRTGYVPLTKDVLREGVAGLERQLNHMGEQPEPDLSVHKWPPCRCGNPVCPDAPKADAGESSTMTRARVQLRENKETHA